MPLAGLAKVETNRFNPQPALSSRTRPAVPARSTKINPAVRIPGQTHSWQVILSAVAHATNFVGVPEYNRRRGILHCHRLAAQLEAEPEQPTLACTGGA